MTPLLMQCKDCGKRTRERTVGAPVGSCPERNHVAATHRYEVVQE